uniref:Short chain dehydrogenase family protein n=1 Tax=Entamoeba histolytica TaxID=5759 RepID=A0A060N051_ENTHI|nr:short chain dehydrogenase family protein [Entamoeba histolytica]
MDIITLICSLVILGAIAVLVRLYAAGGVNHSKRDLSGKVVVITGGTHGMGRVIVEQLANTGATIISCSRNNEIAQKVIEEIKSVHKSCNIIHEHLDLSDLDSVKQCAENILNKYHEIDILINNAGVTRVPYGKTKQGYETQMGVNYLGHFLLTQKLLSALEKCNGRVINYSSVASKLYHRKEFPFVAEEKGFFSMRWYCESKLSMAIMAQELAKRNDNIIAVSLHPGCVNTALWQFFPIWLQYLCWPILQVIFKTPLEGAQTCLHLIHSESITNGAYYADCKPAKHNKIMDDSDICTKLWNDSVDATKQFL